MVYALVYLVIGLTLLLKIMIMPVHEMIGSLAGIIRTMVKGRRLMKANDHELDCWTFPPVICELQSQGQLVLIAHCVYMSFVVIQGMAAAISNQWFSENTGVCILSHGQHRLRNGY